MRVMPSGGLGGEREIKVEKKRRQKQEGATQTHKRWTMESTNQKDDRSKIKGVVNVLGEE